MKTTMKCIIIVITMALLMPLAGCGLEEEIEGEISIDVTPPSPFYIPIPENAMDLRGEIASQLAIAYERAEMAETMGTNDSNGARYLDEQHMLYSWNNVADLTEFYLLGVYIDGFELAGISIGKYGFSYWYRCIMGLEGSVTIHIRRLQYPSTPDGAWQTVKEQMLTRPGGGAYLTEDGMVYVEGTNSIIARIGNAWFRMIVPDRLNHLEFVHNLALEVITTHELVVLNRVYSNTLSRRKSRAFRAIKWYNKCKKSCR